MRFDNLQKEYKDYTQSLIEDFKLNSSKYICSEDLNRLLWETNRILVTKANEIIDLEQTNLSRKKLVQLQSIFQEILVQALNELSFFIREKNE